MSVLSILRVSKTSFDLLLAGQHSLDARTIFNFPRYGPLVFITLPSLILGFKRISGRS